MPINELYGLDEPDYEEFIERFEKWCNPSDLSKIKDEMIDPDIRVELLNDRLEKFFQRDIHNKPWLKWQPTQKQFNIFKDDYDLPSFNVKENVKRYEGKYEFKSDYYYYNSSKNVYADFKKDKIFENTKETDVNFKYGTRTVLRDSKGRFIKHIKDKKSGFWLI